MANWGKRVFQLVVALGSLVPIGAGALGMLRGPMLTGGVTITADLDSHFRYLSGLLLGVGIGFVFTIPNIERRGSLFRLLTGLVLLGGLGRLVSLAVIGVPSSAMTGGLIMELLVTPLLAVWQFHLARRLSREAPAVGSGQIRRE